MKFTNKNYTQKETWEKHINSKEENHSMTQNPQAITD